MIVVYYDDKRLATTCVTITNDWRDDVCSFKFTGEHYQVWIVPNTVDPRD